MLTTTGANADHRLALQAVGDRVVRAGAGRRAEGARGAAAPGRCRTLPEPGSRRSPRPARPQGARSLVLVGDGQPASLHALGHALNPALGNVGNDRPVHRAVRRRADDRAGRLRALVRDMDAGQVEVLLVLGANPVYTAPADLPFAASPQESEARGPPRPLPRRDGGRVRVAPARGALPGILGRRPRATTAPPRSSNR